MIKVLYKTFSDDVPAYSNKNVLGNVGYDLHVVLDGYPGSVMGDDTISLEFAPYEQLKLPANLAVAPQGPISVGGIILQPFVLILGRSGMNSNEWEIEPGVIDPNYRGQLQVLIRNNTAEPRIIRHGDRIAQALFLTGFMPDLEHSDDLPDSDRGTLGFGSSGN